MPSSRTSRVDSWTVWFTDQNVTALYFEALSLSLTSLRRFSARARLGTSSPSGSHTHPVVALFEQAFLYAEKSSFHGSFQTCTLGDRALNAATVSGPRRSEERRV